MSNEIVKIFLQFRCTMLKTLKTAGPGAYKPKRPARLDACTVTGGLKSAKKMPKLKHGD